MSSRTSKFMLLTMALSQLATQPMFSLDSTANEELDPKQTIIRRVEKAFEKDQYTSRAHYKIKASDICTKGLVITKPGSYTVEGNVVFNPEHPESFLPVKFKGGGGKGAKGFALASGGVVRGVAITDGGEGYTSAPQAVFECGGKGAAGYGGFSIDSATVNASGTDYGFPIVIITGDGQGALAVVSGQDGSGGITAITIINPGRGYTNATATIVDDNGTGSGATATINLAFGKITGAVVTAGGMKYRDTVQAAITIKSSNVNLHIEDGISQYNHDLASSIPAYSGTNNPSSQVPYVVGILIPDPFPTNPDVNAVGYESIAITGDQAFIDGFSLFGIRVFGHTANIHISDLDIINTGLLASYYRRPFPEYQPNGNPGFIIYNYGDFATSTPGNTLGTEFTVAGLCLGESDVLGLGPYFFTQKTSTPIQIPYVGTPQNRISSVILKNVNCLDNYILGLTVSNVTDLYINRCHFDGTLTDDPQLFAFGGSFSPAGILGEYPSTLNAVVENSTFNNTSGLGDYTTEAGFGPIIGISGTVSGTQVAFSQNVYFSNSHFDTTFCSFPYDLMFFGTGQQVLGSQVFACTELGYDHCTFNGVNGLYGVAGCLILGLDVENPIISNSRNVSITDFQISNIQSNNQNQLPAPVNGLGSTGILIDLGLDNLTIKNGVISDIITNGPGGSAIGVELGQATNAAISNTIIQNLVTMQGGNVDGFDIFSSDDGSIASSTIEIDNCVVEGCLAMTPTLPYTLPPYSQTRGVVKGYQISALAAGLNPISITNCKALNNKGFPIKGHQYSTGFRIVGELPNQSVQCTIENCEATDNVFGFILASTSDCAIRNCRADFNVSDDGTNTGAGFTDVGTGTVAAPAQSFSLFQSNSAFANGVRTVHTGPNGNYNINVDGAGSPPPLLEGQVSNPASYVYVAPATPALSTIRNVSMIP